jgi:hypothetical protein
MNSGKLRLRQEQKHENELSEMQSLDGGSIIDTFL